MHFKTLDAPFFLVMLLATIVALALGGCYAGNAESIMQDTNARGCLFLRATATPLAGGGLLLVGTWGPDPPPYRECFDSMPSVP